MSGTAHVPKWFTLPDALTGFGPESPVLAYINSYRTNIIHIYIYNYYKYREIQVCIHIGVQELNDAS